MASKIVTNPTFVSPSVGTSVVNDLAFGANELVWSITNAACTLRDTVIITSDVVAADAGADVTVCSPNHILVGNDPAPGSGVWTPSGTMATIVRY